MIESVSSHGDDQSAFSPGASWQLVEPLRQRGDPRRERAAAAPRGRRLRIAMLAPPWIPVPPPGYGGIESVVALLTDGLVRRGHDVVLFAAPGSHSTAKVRTFSDAPHPDEIGASIHECHHVACTWAEVERAAARDMPFDVIHNHSGFTALAMADRVGVPVVHTIHGPLIGPTVPFYQAHGHKALLVSISQSQARSAPAGVRIGAVVPNPIDAAQWPLVREKQPYVLWIGRMTAEKGPHRAIAAARRAGVKLILAGPVQPGQEQFFEHEVAPQIDGDRVVYVGEVAGKRKQRLFAQARALLMPIRWPEPFGMVMVEAMVSGTPVIAFPEGAARELVVPGETGFLVDDEGQMAAACARCSEIDPVRCRRSVIERFDVQSVAAGYERVYETAIRAAAGSGASIGFDPTGGSAAGIDAERSRAPQLRSEMLVQRRLRGLHAAAAMPDRLPPARLTPGAAAGARGAELQRG